MFNGAFLVSRDCCVALPHDATDLSSVFDFGISLSYSLLFLVHFRKSITNNQTDVPKSKCPELVNLLLLSNCDTISRNIYAQRTNVFFRNKMDRNVNKFDFAFPTSNETSSGFYADLP